MINTASDGGKGSTPRPRSVADAEWANRWEAIFGRDKAKQEQQPTDEKEKKDGQGL
jgi:hypothetical protein